MEIKATTANTNTAAKSVNSVADFATHALLKNQENLCTAYKNNDSSAIKESMLRLQQLLGASKSSAYNRLKADAFVSGIMNRLSEKDAARFAFDFVKATPPTRFVLLEEPTLRKLGKNMIERYQPHTNMRLIEPRDPNIVRPKNPISLAAGDALGMQMHQQHMSSLMDAHYFVRDPESIKDPERLRGALKTMVYETEFGERRQQRKTAEAGASFLNVKVRPPSVGLQMPANNGVNRSAS